jgi:hypothetical protein
MSRKSSREGLLVGALGWLLIGIHYLIFSQFFPNAQGGIGHDYSYNLPLLLDGFFWFLNNGLLAVPWFTPAFCGGMPLLANPATFYVSAPQLFSFFTDPLSGVILTFVLFAAFGFWGFYQLLRRVFATGVWPALLGGTLFLFNGFFAFRLVVGHLEFHAFMLVPLLAGLLLAPPREDQSRPILREAGRVVLAAILIAYMFLCGMTQLIVPSMMAVGIVVLVRGLAVDDQPWLGRFSLRLVLAGTLALALSASKLAAALAFLGNFQRDSYLLPGIDGLGRLLLFIVRVLALGGGVVAPDSELANVQWPLSRHEFEFGVTLAPFLLIGCGLLSGWRQIVPAIGRLCRPARAVGLATLLILLAAPIALNFYSPGWNALLKTVPFIRSLSNFFRWIVIYIPFVILLAVLVVERAALFQRRRSAVAIGAMVLALAQNLLTDTSYYHNEEYDPSAILQAYAAANKRGAPPVIADLVVPLDASGRPFAAQNRNDAIASGNSQLLCYEPMFGFRLELFPFKDIMPGPALTASNGWLNLKNPACFLYPRENGCEPGDHFRSSERRQAERFLGYRPFAHARSGVQQMADGVNIAALAGVLLFGLGVAVGALCIVFRQVGRRACSRPLRGPSADKDQ